jgi:hypothetical protein
VPTPILRRIKCRHFCCEVGTELKIDNIRLQRDKRMSQLWSCVQPTVLQLWTVTVFSIFMCIDHTAVVSCVGSTVKVALLSQPESCVISGFRHGVNEICVVLGIYAALKFWRFGTTCRPHLQGSSSPSGNANSAYFSLNLHSNRERAKLEHFFLHTLLTVYIVCLFINAVTN